MAIIGGGERDLTIRLFANVDDFKKNMRGAQKDTEDFGGKVFNTLGKVGLAVASAGAAVAGFAVKLGVDSVKAAIEANKQQERLAALLENTGGATRRQIELLNAQAEELGKLGVATKENVTITQSQLATFDLMGGTIAKLTPAIIDYVIAEKGATATTDDFKSMTNGLAQALNGNFASLTATGFVLDDVTKEMIKTGTETERASALVDVLESTYRGFNETAGQTAEGQLIMLQNAFNDSTAAIGEALLPTLLLLVEAFKDNVLPRIIDFVDFIVDVAIPAIEKFFVNAVDRLTESFGGLRDALEQTNEKMPETGAGIRLIGNIAKEIALSIPKGIVFALELLGKALEGLVRLVGFAVLAFRRDFAGAYEILTGKTRDAEVATARMYLELQELTAQANNASIGLANAYRQFTAYNSVTSESATKTRDLKTLIEEFKNIQYENTLATDKATDSTKRFSQAQRELANNTRTLTALQKELNAMQAGGVAPPSITKDLKSFYKSELGLISQFGGFIEGINLKPTDPFYGFGKGGNVGLAIQQRAGGSATATGGTTIINVNGTVIDPEGAARAIEKVIQQSGNRAGELVLAPLGLGIE